MWAEEKRVWRLLDVMGFGRDFGGMGEVGVGEWILGRVVIRWERFVEAEVEEWSGVEWSVLVGVGVVAWRSFAYSGCSDFCRAFAFSDSVASSFLFFLFCIR